ncbi:MAG: signal peptidase I [Acidobacteria bacterium]|nr:MAG: signal peptidase I [Acidobacteriota bacterium]
MTEGYKKSATRDTVESLVVTVILAVFGTTFVIQAFKIPTGSMEDTLLIGDHLLVNKFAFASQPGWIRHLFPYRRINRDDVVVFKYPYRDDQTQEPGEHFVKRVIGVPGDRIRVANRQVYVNGQPVSEPFVRHAYPAFDRHPGDDFPPADIADLGGATPRWEDELPSVIKNGELIVPPDVYFVMGDNREQSWDSRFWGFAPRDLIAGRPLLIYWSFETPRDEYLHTGITDRLAEIWDLVAHFLTKTRWRRTFRIVR